MKPEVARLLATVGEASRPHIADQPPSLWAFSYKFWLRLHYSFGPDGYKTWLKWELDPDA